ncbi:AAA family ATPase [Rhodococcus pyridinivorans]
MKFVSLDLHNWRSFHGHNRIDFATEADRPVTLLLGPNGSGKTALLNAFTWVLYGKFTEGFDYHDHLVNLEAIAADSSAQASVELVFYHESDEFRIKRTTDARRQVTDGETDLVVTKNGARATEIDVHRILPPVLKDLFFFPAESFSTASILKGETPGDGTSFDIGTAIRAMLSGDVYENAIADLREAIGSSALKPPMNYRDETVETARRAYEQARSELNAAEERREVLPALTAQARESALKAKREAERYNPEEMRKWESRYKELDRSVKEAEQLVSRTNSVYIELARRSHMHFSQCAVATAIARLDLAETAGLMPPRIHQHVLEKTLAKQTCLLCGEHLTRAGEARVSALHARVADAEIAIRGVEIRTRLKQYLTLLANELTSLRQEVTELAALLDVDVPDDSSDMKILASVVRTCLDVADRVHAQAKREFEDFVSASDANMLPQGHNPVEIAMVKQALVDKLDSESEKIDGVIVDLKGRVQQLFSDYEKKSGKTREYARKTRAISILQESMEYFEKAKTGLERFGREDFEKAINATYSDLVKKEFNIAVGADFSIKVFVAGTTERLPLSQSEKVLLLIAFLGAIARLAPHYEKIARLGDQLKDTGGVETSQKHGFPVVLDAPTSPLDDEYEIEVVRALPNLLPQVIVPVSAKSVDVWARISKHVGSTYVMELTSKSATNRTVSWNGKDFTYSTQDDDVAPARTRITRIS